MKFSKLFILSMVFLSGMSSHAQIIDNDFANTPAAIPEVSNVDNSHNNKWYTWNGASATVTTENGYGKMLPNASKPSNFVIRENYTAGDYVVSFDVKKESGESKDIFVNSKSGPDFMTIALNDNSNGGLLADAVSGGQVVATNVRFKIKKSDVSSTWQTYSFDFNVPISFDGSQVYSAVSVGKMTTPGVFNLDNFSIVEKTTMTTNLSSSATSKVYPNPVSDIIHVDTNTEIFSAFLINSQGKILASEILSGANNQLKVGQVPDGFYVLNLISDTKSSTHKIIIK